MGKNKYIFKKFTDKVVNRMKKVNKFVETKCEEKSKETRIQKMNAMLQFLDEKTFRQTIFNCLISLEERIDELKEEVRRLSGKDDTKN